MSVGYHVDVTSNGGLKQFISRLKHIDPVCNIGLIDGATYSSGIPVAYVGYLNEYGGHNPPRPFLKRTMEERYKVWLNVIAAAIKAQGFSESSVMTGFKRAGIVAVGDVKKTIKAWSPSDPRPNKPATIRRKARRARDGKGLKAINPNTVLIDTGIMMRSITYEVKRK